MKNRKIQQNKSSGTGLAASGKVSTQGVCSQWKQHGACNSGDNCPKDHPKDQKGKGKGKAKGNGKGKGKKDQKDKSGKGGWQNNDN